MALSRTIFREYDIRGVAGKDLTEEAATLVAGAYAAFLAEKGVKGAIAVGRDNRPSGEMLHAALVAGFLASGVDVVDIGIVPTPLAYWAQHNLDVVGGIQITGSHNPPEYNGFKLGLAKHSIYGADIQHIYDLAVARKISARQGNASQAKRSSIAMSTTCANRVGKTLTGPEGRNRLRQRSRSTGRSDALSEDSASSRAACSARATGPFPIITPIRRFRRTSRLSSPR